MIEIKNRAVVVLGAVLLAAIGRNTFYRLAQDRTGLPGRLASAYCQGHSGRVGQNYAIFAEGRDSERITNIALRYYSDDSLHGFGSFEFARADEKPLLEQQRGLVVPLVERAIEQVRPAQVLEIGCANGDVLAYLASRHPTIEFIGVDLSVANAERKHTLPNLRFVKGYALDLLRSGQIGGDVVFGNWTFCIFAPKELAAYMDALKDTRQLIISDPVTWGNEHRAEPLPYSRHMDLYMWWHNYYGYMSAAGFTIDHFQTANFAYSYNPGARVVLISGHR